LLEFYPVGMREVGLGAEDLLRGLPPLQWDTRVIREGKDTWFFNDHGSFSEYLRQYYAANVGAKPRDRRDPIIRSRGPTPPQGRVAASSDRAGR
jgi:hypothetical protein